MMKISEIRLDIDAHCSLVPISHAYRDEIFRNFSQNVIRYLLVEKPPADVKDTADFIDHSIRQMKNGNELVWVILVDDQFCGCCGIHGINSGKPHYGLWLKESMQGKGIGTKVTKFVLDWAVNNLKAEYIRYPVDERNAMSLRLIEKITNKIYARYKLGEKKILQVVEYRVYPGNK